MNIRFSVIIPAYNAAATIVATVQSVLAQTVLPFEVIVVNDASTDATEQLLLENFGSVIIYIPHHKNSGPAHARNTGLARATGTHIAFQDADDLWHVNKLEIMQNVLLQHPDVSFIYHPYTLARVNKPLYLSQDFPICLYPFCKLLVSNPIGTPCVVIKAHAGLRFDERIHYMEDYDLFLREGYKWGIWLLDVPLTQVNRPILSTGGQSGNRWRMRRGELKVYLRLPYLNPLFTLLIPFLFVLSLAKHLFKSFRPPRSNY